MQDVVVCDLGGGSVKLGSARQPDNPKVFPNASAKHKGERGTFLGEAMLGMTDVGGLALRRPIDRGYLVAWELQREIMARALKSLLGTLQLPACGLVLTEPYLNLPALREAAVRLALEDLGFASVYLCPPALCSLRAHAARAPALPANAAGCALVVDAGFSFTHAVPCFDWRVLRPAVRRIDLGGKALTNYMKELVSYRSMNMMDETYLLEHVKEQLCFVSQDVAADLALASTRRSPFRCEYVLPDGLTDTWGHVRTEEEVAAAAAAMQAARAGQGPPPVKQPLLQVNNERFMVPEALFHPSDIGMEEAGLAETIVQAVRATHPHLHALLYSNVLLTGGTARCPGFRERLYNELRPLVPDDYELHVHAAPDPALAAWQGAALLGASPEYAHLAVSRQEWKLRGVEALRKWDT
ncbi:Actin-related 6 [Micractinium conductrix]|uniref:Actin-related 6 n=1 Tax=Micractinium conductrix TaxID=554055 RepID=A0A2P6V891_9CHLO|nr:Actin-related 6 [Micractinium conductrix]|eukprot:PSC70298.1 Actin-related 6 [Micractinium conductrix]